MNTTRRARRVLATVVTGAVLVAGSLFGGSAAMAAQIMKPGPSPTPTPVPTRVITALGDSITLAVSSCSSFTTTGCAANSWATGTTTSVNSIAARLAVPSTARYNLAVSGVKVDQLPGQATGAVGRGATHVTIEIGANDACTPTVGGMTDPALFASSVNTAMATLEASPKDPQIYVAAIPSLQTLYDINVGNSSARFTWSLLKVCQSMLAGPGNSAFDGNRTQVQQRVDAYNAALAAACTLTTNCHFADRVGALGAFVRADISTRDYFHPSLAGQAKLAQIAATDPAWAPFLVAG